MRKGRRLAIKWSLLAFLILGLMSLEGVKNFFFIDSQTQSYHLTKDFLSQWQGVNEKLLAMAEDFPADRYSFRPDCKTRSFAEQMLHVANHNKSFVNVVNGVDQDFALSIKDYSTKTEIVEVLKESITEGSELIAKTNDTEIKQEYWAKSVIHTGELYGQLLVYYQLNGLTPPITKEARNSINASEETASACQRLLKKADCSITRPSLKLGKLFGF
ncbi:MAG: hypothetical protein JNM06_14550 [Blastocatellia bacterium]|nr:hypothetical protein [Blastocatellia bacterium]MBN8724457.1 hypothetical protein [Acidobacteriota bacterium]